MLTLHGTPSSNYYNVAKLALLEKGISFREALVYTGAGDGYRPDYLEMSPLGKVPCLETDEGCITESRCIVDYLEHAYPEPALYPKSSYLRAKMLELTQCVDLYLELPARRVLRNVFGGKPPPDRIAAEVRGAVEAGARALRRLARFDSFLIDERFTAADIAGALHFPAVRRITQAALGCDPLAEVPGLVAYSERLERRPTVQRVLEDRDADLPHFFDHIRKHFGS